jgi:serine/threonine-protein kinase RsbW
MAVTVGDVAGRGIEAAAQMGELRTVLRAYTLEDPAPGAALARLNGYILEAGQATFATAVHVLFDPATGALRMASAGHLPVLRRSAGGVELLTPPTTPPLGAPWDSAEEQEIVLDEGDVILLFSDGLVERRHAPIDEQLERLVRAASDAPDDPEAFLDHVMDGMGADLAHGDDVVALVLRRQRAGAKA